MIDPSPVITASRDNMSCESVTTARYMIEVVLNEDDPSADPETHKRTLADEFQRALDAGFFEDLRYDALLFNVTSREVLDTAPANYPEEQPCPSTE